jgi:transposase
LRFLLTPGEAGDVKAYETLIGAAPNYPAALLADKAYDADRIREDLKRKGIKPVIPPMWARVEDIRYDRRLYKKRNGIERHIGFLKQNRRIATRYDKTARSFFAFLCLAAVKLWLKYFVHRT